MSKLRELVNFQIEGGVDGIVSCGDPWDPVAQKEVWRQPHALPFSHPIVPVELVGVFGSGFHGILL